MECEIGCEMILMNIPDIPQQEACDFLIFLMNLAISIGEVFNKSKSGIPSFLTSLGAGSFELETEDFEAKNAFSKLLFATGS